MRLPRTIAAHSSVSIVQVIAIIATVLISLIPSSLQATTALGFGPTSLSFGGVAIGQTETQVVTLTNNSQNNVTISAVGVSNAAFSVSPMALPIGLASGQTVDVSVSFTPTETGWVGGRVTFVTTPSSDTVNVEVGGAGVNTQAVIANPPSVSFGQVAVGTSATTTVALTNTRPWGVMLDGVRVEGAAFSASGQRFPWVLGSGQSITLNVTFAPTSVGLTSGSVFVIGVGLNLPVIGTGIATGTVDPPTTPPVITSGTTASGTVGSAFSYQITATNSATSYGATGLPAGLTVNSTTGLITGTPTTAATSTVTLSATNASGTGNATLTLTINAGAGQLTISPTTLNFGNVIDGSTGVLSTTLSATGGTVTISSASSSNSQFAVSGTTFPLTISSGQSVSVNIAFTPQSTGTASGTLSFSSNATNSPAPESLSGTGTPPYVSLTWNASADAVGYNIYRCVSASCSYEMINTTLNQNTSYTDTTVVQGQTYSYVTTAVNSSGQESGYSNPVEVAVP